MNNVKYLSLFSGIGGFELAIHNAYRGPVRSGKSQTQGDTKKDREGLLSPERQSPSATQRPTGSGTPDKSNQGPQCIGYSEIDKYAIKVYERQFNGHTNYGNATTVKAEEIPDFDLLVGGFPCQAFSIAGKRKGFDDTRGTLFFDIARILSEKRPRHLVLENVKGLLSHDGGKTYQTILRVLSDLGYRVEWQVLNSKNYGVPQNRERIFIIGHLRGECGRKVFPITGTTGKDLEELTQGVSDSQRLFNTNGVSKTLSANGGGQGAKSGLITDEARIRRLTPKECERLQGFPDSWTEFGVDNELISDPQRYKMCGNAVTVNVVGAIFRKFECLDQTNKRRDT